jgi:nitrogen fixation protein FixH
MRRITCFATPLIAVAMMTVPMMAQAQSSLQGNATDNTTTAGATQSKAYADGMESAAIDKAAKRVLDPQKSFRYTHPPIKKGDDKAAYQAEFVAGYQAQLKQIGATPGE